MPQAMLWAFGNPSVRLRLTLRANIPPVFADCVNYCLPPLLAWSGLLSGNLSINPQGIYDDVDNILTLTDTVRLGTDDGYSCETNAAKIFTKDKRISGNAPIACSGGFGDVAGNSFTITEEAGERAGDI